MRLTLIAVVTVAALAVAGEAQAQLVYVTGYAPAPMVVAPPTVVYRPAPTYVTYSPVMAAPAPVIAAPAPVVVGAPVVTTTTRWRPFLGGSVTRVSYGYAPTAVVVPAY